VNEDFSATAQNKKTAGNPAASSKDAFFLSMEKCSISFYQMVGNGIPFFIASDFFSKGAKERVGMVFGHHRPKGLAQF